MASAASAAASSPAPAAGDMDQESAIRVYREMRSQEQMLLTRISDMQSQQTEYRIVVDTLGPLEGSRKCFQLINNVLVERTVEVVLPIVKANHDGIVQVLSTLSDQLEKVQQARIEHQRKHQIRTVSEAEARRIMAEQQAAAGSAEAGSESAPRASTGVLA